MSASVTTRSPGASPARISWVPSGFRRSEVQAGRVLPDGTQEILSGLAPGDRIVTDALILVHGGDVPAPNE